VFTAHLTALSAVDLPTYVTGAITMLCCAAAAALTAAWRLRRLLPSDALRTN